MKKNTKVFIDGQEYIPMNDAIIQVRGMLIELADWKPEDWPVTSKSLKNRESESGKIEKENPLFCEATLYTLFWKEDARSILSRLNEIAVAVGLERIF